MSRNFRRILAWRKADDFAVEIYAATARFLPREERYGLTAQFRTAAVSVPASIAEGSGRESLADFRRFLFIAQGSLTEVEYYLHLARRLGYIDSEPLDRLETMRAETGRTLLGLIRWVGKSLRAGEKT